MLIAVGLPSVEPIGLQLTRTAKAVSRAFDDALRAVDGSVPIWLVLVSIKGQRHGAQRELADAVGVEGPTLTHHLNKMEAAGLVTRTRDPQNRRVHQVELTEAGEATFRRLLGAVTAFDQQLRDGFTENEIDAVTDIFFRLRSNAAGLDSTPLTLG